MSTVKDLKEELANLPDDMIVIVGNPEDYPHTTSAYPVSYNYSRSYWGDDGKIYKIPAGVEHIEL